MTDTADSTLDTTRSPVTDTGRGRILRTGAAHCWDTDGHELDCKGTGQDGETQSGVPLPESRFVDNHDGTVTDLLTELTWLADANAFGEVAWEDALSKTRTLAHGFKDLSDNSKEGDWRLPNIRELLSLVDYGRPAPILADQSPFRGFDPTIYWTSTTLAPAPRLAWMITFGIGPTVFVVKSTPVRIWPVKGTSTRVLQTGQEQAWDADGNEIPVEGSGQDGDPDVKKGVALPVRRFDESRRDGTVRDRLTGLIWLKNANPFGFKTWRHALACCQALEDGSFGLSDGSRRGDWRLPNVREIESLVDYGKFGPCLPKHPFENVRPSSYWTSTSVKAAPTQAMFIILGVGPSIFENKEHPFFVWPVRNAGPRERETAAS